MLKSEIEFFQNIVNGECYSEKITKQALVKAKELEHFEAETVIKGVLQGHPLSSSARIMLSRFICDLYEDLKYKGFTFLSEKDITKLINLPNKLLADYHARIALYEVPHSMLAFYKKHEDRINGDVVIVNDKNDDSYAASMRNSSQKAFFIFSDKYTVSSYFSGVCQKVNLPQALIQRVNLGQTY